MQRACIPGVVVTLSLVAGVVYSSRTAASSLGGYPASGLVSYWSFDEPDGLALDAVGGNDGVLGSAAQRVPGLAGSGAIAFDNSSDAYVDVGSGGPGNLFSCTTGITIAALIQPQW